MVPLPANSVRRALRAIWWVRSRELHLNLGFWLVLLGYNPRKREIENPLYTLYALVFFALWGFMVLLLLADYAGQGLRMMSFFGSPHRAALLTGELAWIALLLAGLRSAVRRSPAVFDEADAQWLVMSPVNRRVVGLVWFFEAGLWRAFWVWAVAIVLGYAYIEATTTVELTAGDLPHYLLAGLRMLAVGIPLHLAADGLAWAVGVWRLQGIRERPGLRYLVPLLVVVLLVGWRLWGPGLIEALVPLTWAIGAGIGLYPFVLGLFSAWMLAAGAILLLLQLLPGFSLSRAAQETGSQAALQAAGQVRDQGGYQEIAQRRRLGTGQAPARFLFRRRAGVLVSRNLIQAMRTLQASDLLVWLGLGLLPLALSLTTDWGAQVWAVLGWVLLLGHQVEQALRKTLSRWWLLRGLPLRSESVVLAELALPVAGAWLALVFSLLFAAGLRSAGLGLPVAGWMMVLAFPGALGVALAAATDQLRQVKSSQVLAGFAPGVSLLGVLLALLAIGLPAGLYWLGIAAWGSMLATGIMLASSLAFDYALWQSAGDRLRSIK